MTWKLARSKPGRGRAEMQGSSVTLGRNHVSPSGAPSHRRALRNRPNFPPLTAPLGAAHCPSSCHFKDWTTAVLNWPALSYSATKPLQMIQNMAALLVFNQPKRTHITPLLISLHWLIVAARIRFEALTLAFRTATGLAHSYFNALLQVIVIERGAP